MCDLYYTLLGEMELSFEYFLVAPVSFYRVDLYLKMDDSNI